ncbi:hybrid sensor histidine kinase/response regulator [Burkholderia anthina]|uniref:Virulence sensor protein BvgS n=1 Tax=Burkholderia anthina TaxID=179879 RepID=A0A6P2GAR4_9BURK|nr:hybrid sensor histidine kinase/response regulator [Burkholderia anthina]MBM2768369.1 response regulator [Burkholderia anthina]VVU50832.1 two-component regulatory system sensor kinase [Burkholderia anthina]
MQNFLKDFDESPLRSFYSLENNLKRERRVFSMVIVLLIFAAIAAAAITITARLSNSLRHEEQIAQAYEQDTADAVLQLRSALLTANMVLELRANGILASRQQSFPHNCTPALPATSNDAVTLRESCDEAVQLLSAAGRRRGVEMILADGSAAYGHLFNAWPPPPTPVPAPASAEASVRKLVDIVFERFRARGYEPIVAARAKRVVWVALPEHGKNGMPVMVAASLVTKGDAVYAVALTSMDLREVLQSQIADLSTPTPIAIDEEGTPLVPASETAAARAVNAALTNHTDGSFHWIPKFGWALRRPAAVPGFGHMIYVLPWEQQLRSMHFELILILSVTAALIVLLLAMFRYWNYRFLTRTYSEASRALENEMLNHLLVQATPVGLCVARKANMEIMVANQIARNVLGLQPSDTRLPDALANQFGVRRQDLATRGSTHIFQFTLSLERHDVGSMHLEVTYAPAVLNREEVFFCAITDMTEHHRAERLLREAKRTSEEAARAKVNFFASMSHEIRTPLASLVGNIELVALGPLAAEQQARVRAMQVSAKGLLQVVNDVLDFSKIDVGELSLSEEWTSITDLLCRIASSYAHLATQQGLRFFTVFDRAIPTPLYFDPVRVSQIVTNLLSNAFKFTQSGKIVLRARWVELKLEISVVDSGIGIPDELKTRLFQPFTQGNSNRLTQARGTGLGLSICSRLCVLMNGHISLDSTVGVGTRIVVELPLRTQDPAVPSSEWTLPARRPVLLCRAPEYQEWLTGLFDPEASAPVVVSDLRQRLEPDAYDYLIATDEFAAADILAWWDKPDSVVLATQDGPLVPRAIDDGSVVVSLFSPIGIKAAAQLARPDHRRRAARAAAHGASPPAARQRFDTLTVLIAEDNLLNRSLLRDQLTTLGARVEEAGNGEEALALLAKTPVDVVLTDIDMPVMNGFALLHAIRNAGMRLPIYAVSASARPEDIAEGRARGFTDYLTKPVPLATLANVLEGTAPPAGPSGTATALDDDAVPPMHPTVPAEYAAVFIEQVRTDLSELGAIVCARDTARLERWLHRLAGGLAVLGPSQLVEHCQDLRVLLVESAQWDHDIDAQCTAIADALRTMQAALAAGRTDGTSGR